jgi:hypothetical protein
MCFGVRAGYRSPKGFEIFSGNQDSAQQTYDASVKAIADARQSTDNDSLTPVTGRVFYEGNRLVSVPFEASVDFSSSVASANELLRFNIQNIQLTPPKKPRRGPNCGANTPIPVPFRSW